MHEQGGEKDGTDLKEKGGRCMRTVTPGSGTPGQSAVWATSVSYNHICARDVWRVQETRTLWPKSTRIDEMRIGPLLFFCAQSRNLPGT